MVLEKAREEADPPSNPVWAAAQITVPTANPK